MAWEKNSHEVFSTGGVPFTKASEEFFKVRGN